MAEPTGIDCVSELKFPLPFWRYILIFQSWQQLRSWIIIVSGTTLSIYFIMNSLTLTSLPIDVVLLGVSFGSIFSVIMVIPVEFHFKASTNRLVRTLVETLYDVGYIQESETEKTKFYRQKLPQWLRWREGNIEIERKNDEVSVKGGIFILCKLRQRIKTVRSENRGISY